MISFDPFYETLKRKGITTYKLVHLYSFLEALLKQLFHHFYYEEKLNHLKNILLILIKLLLLKIIERERRYS